MRAFAGNSGGRAPQRQVRRLITMLPLLVACDLNPSADDLHNRWDHDGDGLSDQVEMEEANSVYGFDPFDDTDADMSIPWGTHANGSLSDGLNFPDVDEGTYEFRPNAPHDDRYDRPDSNDWSWGALVRVVESVGRERDQALSNTAECSEWSREVGRQPAARFAVGDISQRGGGIWYHSYDSDTRHDYHQNGTEVDVRYLRKDRAETPLHIGDSPAAYDTVGTFDLMACFLARGEIAVIYADRDHLGFWNAPGDTLPLQHRPGHANHFHVRLSPSRASEFR